MRTILAIDHDAKACEVYRANVPGATVVCGEVRDLIGDLPAADVILGGPPCQPYSSAGKRAGANDTRDCVPDFYAAVEKVRPRMFLMEEVDAFATDAKFQPVLQRTFKRLTDSGYDVQLRVLDAVDFGVPQFRKRAWLWGVRTDLGEVISRRKWPTPTHCDPAALAQPSMFGCDLVPWVTVGEALGLDVGEPSGTLVGGSADSHTNGTSIVREPTRSAIRRARVSSVDRRDSIRRLTPAECARLQSMPDDFVWPESVAKTHRYRIVGNGWASLMAKRMGEALRAADPASETVIDLFCGGGCGAVGFHGRAWEYEGSKSCATQ